MEVAEQMRTEVDADHAMAFGPQGDELSSEGLADEPGSARPADASARVGGLEDPLRGITPGLRHRVAGAGTVKRGGQLHAQGLVGAVGVVVLSPPLEASLLGLRGRGGRSGRVLLQHPMHLFMRGVVLGTGRPAIRP